MCACTLLHLIVFVPVFVCVYIQYWCVCVCVCLPACRERALFYQCAPKVCEKHGDGRRVSPQSDVAPACGIAARVLEERMSAQHMAVRRLHHPFAKLHTCKLCQSGNYHAQYSGVSERPER